MDPFTVTSLNTVIGRILPEPHAGLLAGILFGTRASLSRQLTDAFITTGTIHIIALSGQNLSIFTGVLATRLATLFSRRLSSVLIIFLLVWFLWFVGPSPSLVRAVIMGSLTLLAVIFGRRNLSLLSLVLAVSIMLVLNPRWIADLGFQLSVLATLGIILFGGPKDGTAEVGMPWFSRRQGPDLSPVHQYSSAKAVTALETPRLPAVLIILWQLVRDDLRITLAAQLLTTPLIFFYFHRLSIIAPFTNVLIGWTMPFIMGLGWVAAIGGYLWLPLGLFPAWAAWVLLTYVIRIVTVTAGFPLASVAW